MWISYALYVQRLLRIVLAHHFSVDEVEGLHLEKGDAGPVVCYTPLPLTHQRESLGNSSKGLITNAFQ